MDQGTAEGGEEYLNKQNFRTLVEWFTAETLLSRPKDPLLFLRALVDEKICQRSSGEDYQPEHATAYAKECYAEASSAADEHGRILARHKSVATSSTDVMSQKKLQLLEKLIKASRVIAMQLDPKEATNSITKQTCIILNADRATLYHLDPASNELVLSAAEGARDIRVPVGQGIAGKVAQTGQIINITDAYADPAFDPNFDLRSGYKTKTILCAPVKNGEGNVVGVLQVLNRKETTGKDTIFNDSDEEVVAILAAQAGIALHNANMHRQAVKTHDKIKAMLEILEAMHHQGDLGIHSVLFTIHRDIQRLVDCDRSTMYLLDASKNELWSVQGEANIRIPANQGICGAVASSGETIMIDDAYSDPRFNKEYDKKMGFRTTSVLAVALKNQKNEIIGVLQLLNKKEGVFNQQDEEILTTFFKIAGPLLDHLQRFAARNMANEVENEFTGKLSARKNDYSRPQTPDMNKIVENENEEES